MTAGQKHMKIQRALYTLQRLITFFLLIGFVVTCCTMLFVSTMQRSMGFVFTQGQIQAAAKVTMINVVVLTLLFFLLDHLRHKRMVELPVRRIMQAAEKWMQGDFSVRIPQARSLDRQNGFDDIARCFNRMAEELSSTETLRTDFIANVSHELKTPLAVMSNYATLLSAPGLQDAQRQEYAAAIRDACRRLSALITNILKLNKLENQQIFPTRETFDLSEQVCQCLLQFEDAWEEKQLDILTDIEENVQVQGDMELMSLVWNNLLSNAVKFTPPGGRIAVTVMTDGPYALVRVADTGCGFDSRVGRHIFEKFYQGDTSHAARGNGLGLALVKRVVDIVHGSIDVESTVGEGSAFTIRIRRN